MVKLIVAAIAGAAIAVATGYFVLLPAYRSNYLAVGEANGAVSARWEIADRLKREFSSLSQSCVVQSELFAVKSTAVYVVSCNGTKAILVKE